jgi:hypothetical protein
MVHPMPAANLEGRPNALLGAITRSPSDSISMRTAHPPKHFRRNPGRQNVPQTTTSRLINGALSGNENIAPPSMTARPDDRIPPRPLSNTVQGSRQDSRRRCGPGITGNSNAAEAPHTPVAASIGLLALLMLMTGAALIMRRVRRP